MHIVNFSPVGILGRGFVSFVPETGDGAVVGITSGRKGNTARCSGPGVGVRVPGLGKNDNNASSGRGIAAAAVAGLVGVRIDVGVGFPAPPQSSAVAEIGD